MKSPLWFAALFLVLSACGFQLGKDPRATAALAQIHLAPMAEREGQIMRLALVAAFQPAGSSSPLSSRSLPYEFKGQVTTQVTPLLDQASDLKSALGTLSLTGTLSDRDGQVLWSGQRSRSDLFFQHTLPSLSQDAQEDLWKVLAQGIAQDMAAELGPILLERRNPYGDGATGGRGNR